MEPSGQPQEIVPGTSFNDAAPVTPGTTYAVDAMPGEVLFFTVPASLGQAVQMQVDSDPAQMSEAQLESLGSVGRLLVRDIYTPYRGTILNLLSTEAVGELDGDSNMIVSPMRPASGASSSGQITFSNRERSEKPATEGDYYLSLAYAPDDSGTPIPLTLTIDVVGEAVPAPLTLDGGDPDQSAATSAPPVDVQDEPVEPTASSTPVPPPAASTPPPAADPGGMPWAWLLGGAGVLVAAAGAALLATRAGRRGTQV